MWIALWHLGTGCSPEPPAPGTLPSPREEPGWYGVEALPHPLQEHGVVTVGDEVWTIGGVDDAIVTLDEVWIFDGSWREGPSIPVPLHHPNVAVHDGDVYVLGGLEGRSFTPTDLAWVLRAGSGSWTALPSLPEPRGAAATGLDGDRIVLAGGLQGGTVGTAVAFDTVAGAWLDLPDLPGQRDHAIGASPEGFWVVGGRRNGLNNVHPESWALVDGVWEDRPGLPTARAGMAGVTLPDGRVLACGGEGDPDVLSGVFEEVELYDGAVWSGLDPMPVPIHGAGAGVFDGGVLVPGGADVRGFAAIDTVQLLVLE